MLPWAVRDLPRCSSCRLRMQAHCNHRRSTAFDRRQPNLLHTDHRPQTSNAGHELVCFVPRPRPACALLEVTQAPTHILKASNSAVYNYDHLLDIAALCLQLKPRGRQRNFITIRQQCFDSRHHQLSSAPVKSSSQPLCITLHSNLCLTALQLGPP